MKSTADDASNSSCERKNIKHWSCPVITPKCVPSFEIPRRPKSKDGSCMSPLFSRRRTESLDLIPTSSSCCKPQLKRRNTLSDPRMTGINSNDPGYDLSLSLKHTPHGTTPYGFPTITVSPTTTRKESLFHESTRSCLHHRGSYPTKNHSSINDFQDCWQYLSRSRCDSGISEDSDISFPTTPKSRTSTFSSISEDENPFKKVPCNVATRQRKFSCSTEETNLNDWGYSSESTTPEGSSPLLTTRRFSANTVCSQANRERKSTSTVKETERLELLKQLHALCAKQKSGFLDMGEIEYWLKYDFARQTLKVLVLRAENVGGRSSSDKVNTYVKVILRTDVAISQQTRVVKHTRDPIFDQELTFPLEPVDVHFATLEVRVYRQKKLTNVLGGQIFLGMVSNELQSLIVCPTKQIREDLQEEPEEEHDPVRMNLSVCYKPLRQKLEVTVVKVADLPRSNFLALPDTEVKVKITQISNGELTSKTFRTKTKRWNTNPVFKEAFSVPVSDIQNLRDGLSVTCTVVCQDHLRKRRSYGKVGLGLLSTQESEREHWKEVLKNPGYPLNRWHNLVEEKGT
ncbi:Synaptotagmin-3 [Holothuria leucospilota]|uniref:Synaptotagmin-3 n=1 Tax=Holothuria leucospilota TaxID=206669 RepID=A0A9Q1H0V6_HOLLE|nr:Synaptotagmin-3 [Holothuria leucospilota]